jgi:hypothetical protein
MIGTVDGTQSTVAARVLHRPDVSDARWYLDEAFELERQEQRRQCSS